MSDTPIHYLDMAVVQEQDTDSAMRILEGLDVSVVYLASTGGFLGRRNATLLIGLPENMEDRTIHALQQTCCQRVEYVTFPLEGSPMPLPTPVPVTVGGVTFFALPVERFEEF
jgi:uncharacterized protein YaaQ